MTLLQLRYLVAIADQGFNVSAAADELCTSQPGVGRQLKLLEEELGEALFVRNGRSLSALTPVGQDVVARARAIRSEVEAILTRVGRPGRAGREEAAGFGQRPSRD